MREMVKDENDFYFALSSINITYFLTAYFHLQQHLLYEKDKKLLASRKSFKSFCSLLNKDFELFYKLNSLLIIETFLEW